MPVEGVQTEKQIPLYANHKKMLFLPAYDKHIGWFTFDTSRHMSHMCETYHIYQCDYQSNM